MTHEKLHKMYIQYLITLDRDEALHGGTAYDLAVGTIPQFLCWLKDQEELDSFDPLGKLKISERNAIANYLEWKRSRT
jgi:hypothetical protein